MNKVMIQSKYDTEPDNINELGIKWWKDDFCTEYAARENRTGISLPNVAVWDIETPEGWRTKLIVEEGYVLFECQQLDGISSRIDMMKLSLQFKE